MDPHLVAAMTRQHGLITRAQALDTGTSPGEIRRLLRDDEWIAVRRGVYTTAEHWASLGEYDARPRLRALAVGMVSRRGWVLSHDSACHVHGLPVLGRPDAPVHLTRPGWTNAWTEHGVAHHLAAFRRDQVVEVDGVRVLDLARTAVDMGRAHGLQAGLVTCDAVLRRGVARSALEQAYAPMTNWPGIRSARAAVALADPGAETPLESLTRELVIAASIGTPETQFPVRIRGGVAWCDLRVGNHVIEADGRVKYDDTASGGLSTDPGQTVWDEKVRERAITDRGLVVTRVVWADHRGRARTEAIARLRRDHREAVARFGAALPEELALEAAELRATYGDRRGA